jgi:negative regulator of genetic competence, sporulation and motility
MFGNNETERRLLKRKSIMDALEKAKEEGITWKVNQLETKLYEFNRKYYPNILWNSAEKGTYKKSKEVKA